MKHTQTPWTVNGNAITSFGADKHICSQWIADAQGKDTYLVENWESNAALIVQAVNEHAALIAIAEAAMETASELNRRGMADCTLNHALSALATLRNERTTE